MNAMTEAQLAEIEERDDAATRPPWYWYDERELVGRAGESDVYEYDFVVLDIDHDGGCGCRSACHLQVEISDPDAEFIAAAREDVPALVAEVRRLRAEADKLTGLYEAALTDRNVYKLIIAEVDRALHPEVTE